MCNDNIPCLVTNVIRIVHVSNTVPPLTQFLWPVSALRSLSLALCVCFWPFRLHSIIIFYGPQSQHTHYLQWTERSFAHTKTRAKREDKCHTYKCIWLFVCRFVSSHVCMVGNGVHFRFPHTWMWVYSVRPSEIYNLPGACFDRYRTYALSASNECQQYI